MLNSYKKKIKRSNEKISESKKLIYIYIYIYIYICMYVCMYVEREREHFANPSSMNLICNYIYIFRYKEVVFYPLIRVDYSNTPYS